MYQLVLMRGESAQSVVGYFKTEGEADAVGEAWVERVTSHYGGSREKGGCPAYLVVPGVVPFVEPLLVEIQT